mgnify:CR=1 FL=1
MKSFISICILLASNCSNPSYNTKQITSESHTNENAITDQITEYGIIKDISDGAYPTYTITLEFPETQIKQSFSLNIEEISLQSIELEPLLNKYVTIKYTSELEKNLTDLQLNGKTILGEEYILETQENWKSVT